MSESLPDSCRLKLSDGVAQLNLDLSDQVQNTLLDYIALLYKWNKAFNLTAVRDPEQMIIRHVLDSLAILPYLDEQKLLDVGTGGGIPGIIIAVCRPEIDISLLDSNGKKTRFLQQVKTHLSLDNVEVIQSRAEDYSPPVLFDRIISRAFTALDQMVHWCDHLLDKDGRFMAMKGTYPEPGQKELPPGWAVTDVQPLTVPFIDEHRHLVSITRATQ